MKAVSWIHPFFVTTNDASALYPFMASSGLGVDGSHIGAQWFTGEDFYYDCLELYPRFLSDPNILIFGDIGQGKSTDIKAYIWRNYLLHRRRYLVIDRKGEYTRLAHAMGCEPFRFSPGSGLTINPLDDHMMTRADQLELLKAFGRILRHREHLTSLEDNAIDLAHETAHRMHPNGNAELKHFLEYLFVPEAGGYAKLKVSQEVYDRDINDLALGYRRLTEGGLRGLFDGPTSPKLSFTGNIIVLNFENTRGDARRLMITCALLWTQSGWARYDKVLKIDGFVSDEFAEDSTNIEYMEGISSNWKLARQFGVENVAIMHHMTQLAAGGSTDDRVVKLALELVQDSSTLIIHHQDRTMIEQTRDGLRLTDAEATVIPSLPRGVALWKIGTSRSFVVETQLHGPIEEAICYTDEAMHARHGNERPVDEPDPLPITQPGSPLRLNKLNNMLIKSGQKVG